MIETIVSAIAHDICAAPHTHPRSISPVAEPGRIACLEIYEGAAKIHAQKSRGGLIKNWAAHT